MQLDSGLTRQYGGTGLGLVLVSRMARVHGGGVRVESAPGEGSRFTIDLPWTRDSVGSGEATAAKTGDQGQAALTDADGGRPTMIRNEADSPLVLLVDDTEAIVDLVVNYLEAHNYRVRTAVNGQSAIALARELKPDLILMDVQMPDIDGLEAVRWIRAESGLEQVPILALTALDMPGDRERFLASGMNDYITKPIRLSSLMQVIETHVIQSMHR